MKVIILAGGYAKRLWPLTKEKPKPLLKLNNKTVIDYIYEKVAGFGEVIVSANERFAPQFEEWGKGKNVKIVIEPSRKEGEKLGAIKGIEYALGKIGIDDDYLIIAGDGLFDFSLDEFILFAKQKNGITIGLFDIKDEEKAKSLGVVSLDEDKKVVSFVEKPAEPETTLVAITFYYVPKKYLNLFSKYDGEKDAPGYFISWLSKKEDVFGFVFEGNWFDIGSFEQLEKAKEFVSH